MELGIQAGNLKDQTKLGYTEGRLGRTNDKDVLKELKELKARLDEYKGHSKYRVHLYTDHAGGGAKSFRDINAFIEFLTTPNEDPYLDGKTLLQTLKLLNTESIRSNVGVLHFGASAIFTARR